MINNQNINPTLISAYEIYLLDSKVRTFIKGIDNSVPTLAIQILDATFKYLDAFYGGRYLQCSDKTQLFQRKISSLLNKANQLEKLSGESCRTEINEFIYYFHLASQKYNHKLKRHFQGIMLKIFVSNLIDLKVNNRFSPKSLPQKSTTSLQLRQTVNTVSKKVESIRGRAVTIAENKTNSFLDLFARFYTINTLHFPYAGGKY